MRGIKFPESNKTLTKPVVGMTDEECGSLPVYVMQEDGDVLGRVISCWQMSFRERLSALFFGRVWLWVRSGPSQPPVALLVKRQIFKKTE